MLVLADFVAIVHPSAAKQTTHISLCNGFMAFTMAQISFFGNLSQKIVDFGISLGYLGNVMFWGIMQ